MRSSLSLAGQHHSDRKKKWKSSFEYGFFIYLLTFPRRLDMVVLLQSLCSSSMRHGVTGRWKLYLTCSTFYI